MLIAQISDCHVAAPGSLTYGPVDNAAALKRVVRHVNAGARRPDIAIISGDITNDGTRSEALFAKAILDDLDCPYLVLPGNHDDRKTLHQVFGQEHCPAASGAFLNFQVALNGVHIIGVDSVDQGLPGGAFCEARAEWLEMALASHCDLPVLMFLHHPPLALGIPETDEDGFKGQERLAQIVGNTPEIMRICAGHIHLATQSMWKEKMVVTAPSIGMELTRSFEADSADSKFLKGTPGYLMHHRTKAGNLVSHVVNIPENSTTYPFSTQV